MKKVLASGYFDPLHIGHLEYLQKAKALGDYLIVAVNSDQSAIRKKGYFFMTCEDRKKIISALKVVDEVIDVVDEDDTVAKTIDTVKPDIFAKGGDRTIDNLPTSEIESCKRNNVEIITNLGDKIESSSSLVEKYNKNKKRQ